MARRIDLVSIVVGLILSASCMGDELECPQGTRPSGEPTPDVREAWCELATENGVVLHGPYRAWWPNGTLGTSGEYFEGQPVGKWTGWYPSGRIQGEQWFEDGEVVRERYWNEAGEEVPELIPVEIDSSLQTDE